MGQTEGSKTKQKPTSPHPYLTTTCCTRKDFYPILEISSLVLDNPRKIMTCYFVWKHKVRRIQTNRDSSILVGIKLYKLRKDTCHFQLPSLLGLGNRLATWVFFYCAADRILKLKLKPWLVRVSRSKVNTCSKQCWGIQRLHFAGEMTPMRWRAPSPLRMFLEQMEMDVWVNRTAALNFTVVLCSSAMEGCRQLKAVKEMLYQTLIEKSTDEWGPRVRTVSMNKITLIPLLCTLTSFHLWLLKLICLRLIPLQLQGNIRWPWTHSFLLWQRHIYTCSYWRGYQERIWIMFFFYCDKWGYPSMHCADSSKTACIQ